MPDPPIELYETDTDGTIPFDPGATFIGIVYDAAPSAEPADPANVPTGRFTSILLSLKVDSVCNGL